jgi:hypothetical protein
MPGQQLQGRRSMMGRAGADVAAPVELGAVQAPVIALYSMQVPQN